jgi:hypothetical protein
MFNFKLPEIPEGTPRSEYTILEHGVTSLGNNPLTLVHKTAGWECAGAGKRITGETWGALFECKDGTTGGNWYNTLAEAKSRFDAIKA